MRVAAYIRVSSKSQTLDMQRVAIERATRARGDTITDWYSDKLSARSLSRPGLERLRQAAREGRVPRLYVYRLDRLARSGTGNTFEVIEELRGHSCELVTVADGLDLAGPAAEVVLAVMAWAAKMERLGINERIAAARVRLGAGGPVLGAPSPPVTPQARPDRRATPTRQDDPRDRHRGPRAPGYGCPGPVPESSPAGALRPPRQNAGGHRCQEVGVRDGSAQVATT